MKTKLFSIAFAAISILFVSCGNKPEQVVEKYLTHFYKAEYKEANEYVAKDKKGLCELLDTYMPETEKEKAAKNKVSISNIKCEIKDDTTAICSCQIAVQTTEKGVKESEESTEQIKLKKIKGKWYINQGKEDFMDEGDNEDAVVPSESEEYDFTEEEVEATEEIILEKE